MTKTLCSAPFFHQVVHSTGQYNLCCSARTTTGKDYSDWNGADYQAIRKHMLEEDELPAECMLCTEQEESGAGSQREQLFRLYNSLDRPALDTVTGTSMDAPISLDLRMNNLCNLSCRMCGPEASTMILKEAKKNPDLPLWDDHDVKLAEKVHPFDIETLIKNAGSIFDLSLLGGEPSVQPESIALLEELVRLKKTNIRLFITTNGTNHNPKFFNLIQQFNRLCVTVSIDGWGKQHEYIRGPGANWDTIWKNVKKIQGMANNPKMMLQQTVTTLNIFDFWKLNKFNDTGIEIMTFHTYGPPKYSPMNIPDKWKKIAISIAKENSQYEENSNIWHQMNKPGDIKFVKGMKDYTAMLDSVRNQYLIDNFPIAYEMFEDIG